MVHLLRLLGPARAPGRGGPRGCGSPAPAGGGLIQPALVCRRGEERPLEAFPPPLSLDALLPAGPGGEEGAWEVEIGFGKGKYLLARALAEPGRRFLGIEMATKYYRILAERAAKRGAGNLVAIRGEALYLLSAVLPAGFAAAVHVYHPDPWPKARHHKRRLFDPETVDLVLGLLQPGGRLFFATDFLDYGELVVEILSAYPGLEVSVLDGGWPGGPRTNYEAKYAAAGKPILRLTAELPAAPCPPALHPAGAARVLAAV